MEKAEDDPEGILVQEKGLEHERAYLASLRSRGLTVAEIVTEKSKALETLAAETLEAMRSGVDIVYQATLRDGAWMGYADFLRRVERPSALGTHSYEAVDTKLAVQPRPKFLIQLCVYSDLIASVQEAEPHSAHLVLGDGTERSYRVADFSSYFRGARQRLIEFVERRPDTYPERCEACKHCHWRDLCQARWVADDNLNEVADIRRSQIHRLAGLGICTVKGLAEITEEVRVPGIGAETLVRLRRQAQLQVRARETGELYHELLPSPADEVRGFGRFPPPNPGDLYFDMEGDPLYPEGLEYLFGLYYMEDGRAVFRPYWAHSHAEEKRAFEEFMDFVIRWIARHPKAHIYHYGAYEATALKRLMSRYGTREHAVDNLLRQRRLVDLYKVVREAIMISESAYSLKNVEHFYMGDREAELKTAAGSIVYYEQWRQTHDERLLEDIRRYNEDDCRSTRLLREWLLSIRPSSVPWFQASADVKPVETRNEIDEQLRRYEEALIPDLPDDPSFRTPEQQFREQVYFMLDFHRREAKPAWWAFFDRQEMGQDELVEDGECLGDLTLLERTPAEGERSDLCTFTFPQQEAKFRVGHECHRVDDGRRLGTIEALDLDQRRVAIKISTSAILPDRLSLMPGGPLNTKVLRKAIYRFADHVIAGDGRYGALEAILRRNAPVIEGHVPGMPIADGDSIDSVVSAVRRLQNSHLFIQGPPGSGKTYTGSHIAVRLMAQGCRIGVTSNSHKAINHLLRAIESVAEQEGVAFRGVKKSSERDEGSWFRGKVIGDVFSKGEVRLDADLIAGTAWLFAEPTLDQAIDYLIVDEAGQVSLGHLAAMGTAARNIILLGDHMQLSQPTQGVHPGNSGASVLEYLLEDEAVIPPDRGIFLPTTRRMHESVCRFISDAVYDGQLHPHPDNNGQRLVLGASAHPELRPTGIRFVEVQHQGRSQHSPEEAEIVRGIFESLLKQRYVDRNGKTHDMGLENILVISPYNMQVNLLASRLPDGARVGTVDKFQGQEAEVALVSMATSSGEDLPRHLEFLFSKNRLNVAISRARCLAVVVASPDLLSVSCGTVDQMQLVNTMCWLRDYSAGFEWVATSSG